MAAAFELCLRHLAACPGIISGPKTKRTPAKPLTTNLQLTIVLPAYEEAANLDNLLPRLAQVAGQLAPQFEILVVDTPEPRDDTPAVCRKYGGRYVPRRGGSLYGHAIRTALEEARGEWIIFMDPDGSHNPGFLPQLWRFPDNFDLVIASRYG